ncbi:MAG: hypothetical protein ACKO38_19945, partial [Planctomycetota bacterium]
MRIPPPKVAVDTPSPKSRATCDRQGSLSGRLIAFAAFAVLAVSGPPASAWQKPPRYYGLRTD